MDATIDEVREFIEEIETLPSRNWRIRIDDWSAKGAFGPLTRVVRRVQRNRWVAELLSGDRIITSTGVGPTARDAYESLRRNLLQQTEEL